MIQVQALKPLPPPIPTPGPIGPNPYPLYPP
jgi:hypothetical protein